MGSKRSAGISSIIAGCIILYVGWANVEGLKPPFLLCPTDSNVHLGPNYAIVYNGGCAPYDYAHELFVFVTIVGLTLIASGLYIERKY